MESAIFGLIGVVVGALLTGLRELWFQRRKDAKEREFLAIQVSGHLERYVSSCADVVADDGLYMGAPNEHGEHEAQALIPTFEPELLKVEWKSLSATMMYEILDLPVRAEEANAYVTGMGEHATPPDYSEWFEERQYQYAMLGLAAADLAARLRSIAGLPPRPARPSGWDPVQFMANRRSEIDQRREKLAEMISRRQSARS
jgi:hypothetical protein